MVTRRELTEEERRSMELAMRDAEEANPSASVEEVFEAGYRAALPPSPEPYEDMEIRQREEHPELDPGLHAERVVPVSSEPQMPADLLAVLSDPSIIISRDQGVFELIAKWQKAEHSTISVPARPVVEATHDDDLLREALRVFNRDRDQYGPECAFVTAAGILRPVEASGEVWSCLLLLAVGHEGSVVGEGHEGAVDRLFERGFLKSVAVNSREAMAALTPSGLDFVREVLASTRVPDEAARERIARAIHADNQRQFKYDLSWEGMDNNQREGYLQNADAVLAASRVSDEAVSANHNDGGSDETEAAGQEVVPDETVLPGGNASVDRLASGLLQPVGVRGEQIDPAASRVPSAPGRASDPCVEHKDGRDCPVHGPAAPSSSAPEQLCGAQDWDRDEDGEVVVLGTCGMPAGHEGNKHHDFSKNDVWHAWHGRADRRAPVSSASERVERLEVYLNERYDESMPGTQGARDAALELLAVLDAVSGPPEAHGRLFRGVGELEREGYIDPVPSGPPGQCESTWPTAEGLVRCSLPAGHPPPQAMPVRPFRLAHPRATSGHERLHRQRLRG